MLSVEAFVNANRAEGSRSLELLHWGFAPPSNLHVITECSFIVVVSIPERHWGSTCASTLTSHHWLPLILTGVDSWDLSSSFNLSSNLVNEIAVSSTWSLCELAARWRIVFHINPDHSVVQPIYWLIFFNIGSSPFSEVTLEIRVEGIVKDLIPCDPTGSESFLTFLVRYLIEFRGV